MATKNYRGRLQFVLMLDWKRGEACLGEVLSAGSKRIFVEHEDDLVLRSSSVPEAGQLAFGPENVLVRSATSLVFPLEDVVKLLQIGERRFVVIGPGFILRTLSLETPGSTGFDHPDLSLGSIFVPLYPGMAVMHSL